MYSKVMRASLFSSVGQKNGLEGKRDTEARGDPVVIEGGREDDDDPRLPIFLAPRMGEL